MYNNRKKEALSITLPYFSFAHPQVFTNWLYQQTQAYPTPEHNSNITPSPPPTRPHTHMHHTHKIALHGSYETPLRQDVKMAAWHKIMTGGTGSGIQ